MPVTYRELLRQFANKVVIGDALEKLKGIPNDFVQCVVTSPPYYGLRDYGTRRWFGGDNPDCEHGETKTHGPHHPGQVEQTKWKTADAAGKGQTATTCSCTQCGAWYGQLGLEPTPEQFVEHLVEVFREIRRVLRPDGVFWLNIGDSYVGGGGFAPDAPSTRKRADNGYRMTGLFTPTARDSQAKIKGRPIPEGYKPKDLIGIPWLLAFALRKDGWYLRSETLWEKPNVMPESVRDRPTRSHEQVFLLTKNSHYFYDQEAEREPFSDDRCIGAVGRNLRTVWRINPHPYRGAHFAVFPPALPERCIRLGTSEHGACSECGSPYERVVERVIPEAPRFDENVVPNNTPHQKFSWDQQRIRDENPPVTRGWEPTCECDAGVEPCLVLDPFSGSGTTVSVAVDLGRSYLGVELNEDYAKLKDARLKEPLERASGRDMYNYMQALDQEFEDDA